MGGRWIKHGCRYLLAALMVFVGVTHFINPEPYMRIVPPYLPRPLEAVYVSGLFEVLGGIGLLVPRTRRLAAWGLIALYVCVFPANIHAALHNIPFGEGPQHPAVNWIRLPFQLLFIAWAWWFTRPDAPAPARADT